MEALFEKGDTVIPVPDTQIPDGEYRVHNTIIKDGVPMCEIIDKNGKKFTVHEDDLYIFLGE